MSHTASGKARLKHHTRTEAQGYAPRSEKTPVFDGSAPRRLISVRESTKIL